MIVHRFKDHDFNQVMCRKENPVLVTGDPSETTCIPCLRAIIKSKGEMPRHMLLGLIQIGEAFDNDDTGSLHTVDEYFQGVVDSMMQYMHRREKRAAPKVTWPVCGCDDAGPVCGTPAVRADRGGEGFSATHKAEAGDSGSEASTIFDFDAWWCAASIGKANGDDRWDSLEYGQTPIGWRTL